jgi:hypothetical protein
MPTALQFKVTLNYTTPIIWRRLQVPDTYTFWDLHCAIQAAMGWSNSHLHAFYLADKTIHNSRPIIIQMPLPYADQPEALYEAHEYLTDWFPRKLKQCMYTYDFGDSWDHTVLFERSLSVDQKTLPRCTAGANACPPDDCGGPPGYERLIKAVNNPVTAEDIELCQWLGLHRGDHYDPTNFSIEQIQFFDPNLALKDFLIHTE